MHLHVSIIIIFFPYWWLSYNKLFYLSINVSSAEYRLFYSALLQKRPIILRSLLSVATSACAPALATQLKTLALAIPIKLQVSFAKEPYKRDDILPCTFNTAEYICTCHPNTLTLSTQLNTFALAAPSQNTCTRPTHHIRKTRTSQKIYLTKCEIHTHTYAHTKYVHNHRANVRTCHCARLS